MLNKFGAQVKVFAGTYFQDRSLLGWLQRYRWVVCPFETVGNAMNGCSGRLLDVGCGAGLFVGAAVKYGEFDSAVGIDPSHSAVDRARMMVHDAELDDRLEIRQVAGLDDWPSGRFRTITCIDVLHHVERSHRDLFLDQLVRLLDEDGTLIIKDMAAKPLFFAFTNVVHDLILARQLVWPVDQKKLIQDLSRRGLEVTFERTDRCLWYLHYTVTLRKQ